MMKTTKHLSSIANEVIQRCAQKAGSDVESLVEEFERENESINWSDGDAGMGCCYSRKLVEMCCSKALAVICGDDEQQIMSDASSLARFTYDMMLAWEMPTFQHQQSYTECVAKEREEKKKVAVVNHHVQLDGDGDDDDIPLFYSDLMPLLVDHQEPSVGEDAFVWVGTLVPLIVDVVNARFTFETLTAPTAFRLHFPAYSKFLQEIHKCIKHLQKQEVPRGVDLVDDEFILHVEGTATSHRVVRHIGGTSWPGRLTLTNYALYFEASGAISYEHALKLDLSKQIDHSVKPCATGPWGAPIFDKAIVYESSQLQLESVVLEFPEMTSSTRRDHWLALVNEVILLHKFLSKLKVGAVDAWEMHARTILGIIRLHAAREMLRISPPLPNRFLIFALLDELPKGDYVLQQLADSLRKDVCTSGGQYRVPCSASSILRTLNVPRRVGQEASSSCEDEAVLVVARDQNLSSLESALNESREEAKQVEMAKVTTEGLREEGISESAQVLMGLLLKPLKSLLPWSQQILTWEKPTTTLMVAVTTLIVVYKEWAGKAMSALLLWMVVKMMRARRGGSDKWERIVIETGSDQTTMESIVLAQHGLRSVHEMMQKTNITLLKIWSIIISRTPKHTNRVMMVMGGCAVVLAVVPLRFILMVLVLNGFLIKSKLGKHFQTDNRRAREWWDSIPVVPLHLHNHTFQDN